MIIHPDFPVVTVRNRHYCVDVDGTVLRFGYPNQWEPVSQTATKTVEAVKRAVVARGKPAQDNQVNRTAGRPKTQIGGRKREIYVSSDAWEAAKKLGGGNASEGIRLALAAFASL